MTKRFGSRQPSVGKARLAECPGQGRPRGERRAVQAQPRSNLPGQRIADSPRPVVSLSNGRIDNFVPQGRESLQRDAGGLPHSQHTCDRGQFRVESVDMKDGQRFLQDRPAQGLLNAKDTCSVEGVDRIRVQTKGAGHLAESPLFVARIPNCTPFLFKRRIPDATRHEPPYDGINKASAGLTKSILVNPLAAFTIQELQSAPSKPVVLPSHSSSRIEGHHMNIGKPITFP